MARYFFNRLTGNRSESSAALMPFIQQIQRTNGRDRLRDVPTYNVLLIGQSQSGKSTFLEAIQQYEDPRYIVDSSRIGRGNIAHTTEPRVVEIETCLPAYKVYEANQEGRQEIDMKHYLEETVLDDFKALLRRQEGLEVTAESSTSCSRFRIIDTPGLDDSDGRDVEILGRIFSVIAKLGHLHLVVITDSHKALLAPGYKAALKTYSTLFSTMHGLMVFVGTHISNKYQHAGLKNSEFNTQLTERTDIISDIMGRSFPQFKIDCNLKERRPFHICVTRNTIRDILHTATIKTAVKLDMKVHKTVAMKEVDEIVYKRYTDYVTGLQRHCKVLDAAERLRIEIDQQKSVIDSKEDELLTIDTDELLHLYEVRFAQDWEHFYIVKPTLLQYSTFDSSIGASYSRYPAVEILTRLYGEKTELDGETIDKFEEKGAEEDGCVIDKVLTLHSGVDVMEESGGEGRKVWKVLFKRKSYVKGHYHAVLSIKSRNKYRTRIDSLRLEISRLKEELEILEQALDRRLIELELQGVLTAPHGDPRLYQSLSYRLPIFRRVMDATKSSNLKLEVFIELAKSGAYRGGSSTAKAEALEKFWAHKLKFDPNDHST
ncbi:hypothetical protein BGZ68_000273 [Mortierella alpina]|nr:hypothetical protein BGZ68_000273 [Mortierella alpina]